MKRINRVFLDEAEEKSSDVSKLTGMLISWTKIANVDTKQEAFDKLKNDTYALIDQIKGK